MIQKRTHLDDAVSPVVGVMLMLVVTIVIAAIVAVFATGLASDTQASKTAVFSVDMKGVDYVPVYNYGVTSTYLGNVTFDHRGGDAISLDDLAVEFICYGDTRTLSSADIKTVSGSKAVSIGDALIVNATSSGVLLGVDLGDTKVVSPGGTKVNYKIIYTPKSSIISSGEIICV